MNNNYNINFDDPILITGSNGFIGSKLVETLFEYGFSNLRCFVRPSSNTDKLEKIITRYSQANIQIIKGNLLSRQDCLLASDGANIIYHLAAGIDKSFAGTYMNSVVTTRNLLEATIQSKSLKRFVNVSSFAVYSGLNLAKGNILDESCEIEAMPQIRGAYCYGKAKQDELLLEYSSKYNIPYVILRPGSVYGPGKNAITGRVGIGTFGIFLLFGGATRIPLSYIDNCADAIALSGIVKNVENETFNIVDDDIPTGRQFIRLYKKNVGHFKSIYVPRWASYLFCVMWDKYSKWSKGQLPPLFNKNRWAAEWKGHRYSNEKIKRLLGWRQKVSFADASNRYFEFIKECNK